VAKTRDEHTATLFDGSMVIFGGFEEGERVNTLSRFHFSTKKWEKIVTKTGSLPEARAGHSAVLYKDLLIIFGGKNEENEKLNDVWAFSFTTHTWS
jgi:N-acetylneuraminic acid mutarotase